MSINNEANCPIFLATWYQEIWTSEHAIVPSRPWTQTWAQAITQAQNSLWSRVTIKTPTSACSSSAPPLSTFQICLYPQDMNCSPFLSLSLLLRLITQYTFAHRNSAHLPSIQTTPVFSSNQGQRAQTCVWDSLSYLVYHSAGKDHASSLEPGTTVSVPHLGL